MTSFGPKICCGKEILLLQHKLQEQKERAAVRLFTFNIFCLPAVKSDIKRCFVILIIFLLNTNLTTLSYLLFVCNSNNVYCNEMPFTNSTMPGNRIRKSASHQESNHGLNCR